MRLKAARLREGHKGPRGVTLEGREMERGACSRWDLFGMEVYNAAIKELYFASFPWLLRGSALKLLSRHCLRHGDRYQFRRCFVFAIIRAAVVEGETASP